MKILVLVGDYFEDTELISPVDVWKRHDEIVEVVSMMGRKNVTSKCLFPIETNLTFEEIENKLDQFDMLFIPGGPGSFKILAFDERLNTTIKYFVEHNKVVTAICAAPMLIGRLGYFSNRNYTVYPGFENQILGGTYHREKGVVEDGNFITGKSMYYSIEFALKVIEHFYGENEARALEASLKGEK
jgi:4-methyl-5(b-hydroxyethyl)-thiazole monophosphate biosynthesis